VLISHGSKKAFLVPDSCRATERNGNSTSADITEDTFENDFFYLTTVYTYCVYPAFLFNDCVLILCLFCNIKKSKTTAKSFKLGLANLSFEWEKYYTGGWMYVIIGSHFVALEGKFLLIALVIVRITLKHFDNVIFSSAKMLSKCSKVWQQVHSPSCIIFFSFKA
jgi:hypothetical protein